MSRRGLDAWMHNVLGELQAASGAFLRLVCSQIAHEKSECALHFHKNNALCVAVLSPPRALYPSFVGPPSGSFM